MARIAPASGAQPPSRRRKVKRDDDAARVKGASGGVMAVKVKKEGRDGAGAAHWRSRRRRAQLRALRWRAAGETAAGDGATAQAQHQ